MPTISASIRREHGSAVLASFRRSRARISPANPAEITAATPVLDGRLTLAQRNPAQLGTNDPDGGGQVPPRDARLGG
jgi:hypothetical protein